VPDGLDELKEAIQETAQREIGRNSALVGLELGLQGDALRNAFGGTLSAQDPAEFATGYDGTETTAGFMFDLSLFDSADTLL
jgi:hypothetical protein